MNSEFEGKEDYSEGRNDGKDQDPLPGLTDSLRTTKSVTTSSVPTRVTPINLRATDRSITPAGLSPRIVIGVRSTART